MNPMNHYHYQQLLQQQQPHQQSQSSDGSAATIYSSSYMSTVPSFMTPSTSEVQYPGSTAAPMTVTATSQPLQAGKTSQGSSSTRHTVPSATIWNPMNPTPSSGMMSNVTTTSDMDVSVDPLSTALQPQGASVTLETEVIQKNQPQKRPPQSQQSQQKHRPQRHPTVPMPPQQFQSSPHQSQKGQSQIQSTQAPPQPPTKQHLQPKQLQVATVTGSGSGTPDNNVCYLSLLAMAETFRTMSPPNMRLCLHCLKAILTFKLPVNLEARTHLQIGKILFQHSRNDDQIKFYLEKARALAANLRPPDDVIKFEADDLLADFFERLGERYDSMHVLNGSLSISTNNPYWQCRALLKLAQANVAERDIHNACDILAMGAEFAQIHNSDYTRGLFLLSKCMLLLTNRQLSDVNNSMTVVKHLIDNLNGGTPYQKEALRIFYLIVTVSHTLIVGQNKSARPNLRLLHQAIQQFAAMDEDMMRTREVDQFQWLPREQMVVLVYLITAMHSMQWGFIDKALKYTDKALTQIEKLSLLDSSPILSIFQLSTLEHIVMCRLVSGNKTSAVQVIGHLCRLCMANPVLMHRRGPQLHTLLGLYAMSMNCMDNADAQFHMALKLSAQQSSGDPTTDPLTIFIVLNLALVCLRQGKTAECHDLLAAIKADSLPVDSHYSLRASAYFVKGLAALFAGKYHEARSLLRETLKMANQEDLHRLIACSLVVLGQTFMNMGNLTEAQNMLKPAINVANCIPDISVQLWSASLLKDMYSLLANRAEEENWKNMHGHYSQSVINDHIDASSQQEHSLINWLDGPLPDVGCGGSGSGGSAHQASSSSVGHTLMNPEENEGPSTSSLPTISRV